MKRKLTDEQEAEIARRYDAGEGAPGLATAYGVSCSLVCRAIRRQGGQVDGHKLGVRPTIQAPSPTVLRGLYNGAQKLSVNAVAARFGVSRPTAAKWLVQAGIPLRSSREQYRLALRLGRVVPTGNGNLRPSPGFKSAAQKANFMAAARTPDALARAAVSRKRRIVSPCAWCGASVERQRCNAIRRAPCCGRQHAGSYAVHRKLRPTAPRPLILALFLERMAELRKQGLPIGAATMQKAAEPIGAGGIELGAYLVTLTPREMDEYLDNQLEHDVRAAGL